MKFSTRKDIEAPLKFVFNRISDFAAIERQIMRRGVELATHRWRRCLGRWAGLGGAGEDPRAQPGDFGTGHGL